MKSVVQRLQQAGPAWWLGLLAVIVPPSLSAQVSVLDDVSTFRTLGSVLGTPMSDPIWDQQTGQGADDFVGDGTNGYYGFYYKFGQISGVDSLVFRFRFNVLTTQQGSPKFTGNPRIGVDSNGDGKIDLYFGVSTGSGQNVTIDFQNPTGTAIDANTSPNTSALGTNYGTITGSASNYDYGQVTDGSAFLSGSQQNQVTPDAFLTFAVPFSNFASALGANTGQTIDPNFTYLRFVAFTSTQGNAVNQDVYGITGIGTTRYDQGGGFTDYYSSSGQLIPEPATYLQFGVLALAAAGASWWKLRRTRKLQAA
ncbi:MAG: hypothetical protein HY302_14205 [Opitutae bacterium]|nr:hypothetical protein [Opitutae bacterium]